MIHNPAQRFEVDVVVDLECVSEDAVDLSVGGSEFRVLGRHLRLHRFDVEALGLLLSLLLLGSVRPLGLDSCPLRLSRSLLSPSFGGVVFT